MDRFVAKLVPASEVQRTHIHTRTRLSAALGGCERGCTRSQWGTNSLSRAPPTPLSVDEIVNGSWMDRMWRPHSATQSEQPETRHFARYRAPISLSINPVSLSLSLTSWYLLCYRDGDQRENNNAVGVRLIPQVAKRRIKRTHRAATCWLLGDFDNDDFRVARCCEIKDAMTTLSSRIRTSLRESFTKTRGNAHCRRVSILISSNCTVFHNCCSNSDKLQSFLARAAFSLSL